MTEAELVNYLSIEAGFSKKVANIAVTKWKEGILSPLHSLILTNLMYRAKDPEAYIYSQEKELSNLAYKINTGEN